VSLRALCDMIDDYLAIEEQGRRAQDVSKKARRERLKNVREIQLAVALAAGLKQFRLSTAERRQLDGLLDRYGDELDARTKGRIERMLLQ